MPGRWPTCLAACWAPLPRTWFPRWSLVSRRLPKSGSFDVVPSQWSTTIDCTGGGGAGGADRGGGRPGGGGEPPPGPPPPGPPPGRQGAAAGGGERVLGGGGSGGEQPPLADLGRV